MIVKPQNIKQTLMFSSIDELIGPDHPVRLINAIIDTLMKNGLHKYRVRGSAKTGRPAYSAETLLKIFVYGYINRINSSRRLEQETYRNIELMWLIGNLHPDHKTISDFRKENEEVIKNFSKDLKLFLKGSVLPDNISVVIDGTKLKANANREMISKKVIVERLKAVENELEIYLKQSEEYDLFETSNQELGCSEDYLTKISSLENEIADLKSQYDEFNRSNKNYISPTDPECSLMKSRDGGIPAYNVQFGCDSKYNFLVYESVTDEANDLNQLMPVVDSLENELSIVPEQILADTGYSNLEIIQKIEEDKGIQCYVQMPKAKVESIKFTYDEINDCYICSQGQVLALKSRNKKARNSLVNVYVGLTCTGCPLKEQCTESKKGHHISRYVNHDFRQNHRQKMKTSEAKSNSILRKSSIEHIHGTMKVWLGKIPLLLRGKDKVISEIRLFSIGYNIKRLLSLFSFDELMAIIRSNIALNCQRTSVIFYFENKIWSLKSKVSKFFGFLTELLRIPKSSAKVSFSF